MAAATARATAAAAAESAARARAAVAIGARQDAEKVAAGLKGKLEESERALAERIGVRRGKKSDVTEGFCMVL